MLGKKIKTNALALGALLHEVTEDQAAVIRIVRTNLMELADLAEELEGKLYVPIREAEAKPAADIPPIGPGLSRLDPRKLAQGRIVVMVPKGCEGDCASCAVANL
jgi:hypothetical protein